MLHFELDDFYKIPTKEEMQDKIYDFRIGKYRDRTILREELRKKMNNLKGKEN